MKKILFAFAAAVTLFASCNQNDNTPVVEFALTDQMVAVGNENVSDANIIVDGTNVYIEIPYENKAALAALEVVFENLPEGVAVEDLTFDFSQGATAQVTFTKQSTDFVYTVSAVAAQPNPRFSKVELTYAGADAASSEDDVTSVAGSDLVVKFKSGTALNALKFAYEVLPAGTKVYKDGEEVAQNAVIDFSATDGVKFTLECENVENEYTVKAVTSGISGVTRVWGRYMAPSTVEKNWYEELSASGVPNNLRNVAMDDAYIYMPCTETGLVYIIDRATGNLLTENVEGNTVAKTLKNTINGTAIEKVGQWICCDAAIMDNNGASVLLVAGAALSTSHKLEVYAYTSIDAEPIKLFSYDQVPEGRFGDKISITGNWADGQIIFYNQKNTSVREALAFKISNGVVGIADNNPTRLQLGSDIADNNYAALYKYSETEWLWAGTGSTPHVYSYSNGTFTHEYACTSHKNPTLDVNFFTFNDEKYMAYVALENGTKDATLRIADITYPSSLEDSMKEADLSKDRQLTLNDPSQLNIGISTIPDNVAFCDVRQINGETYIVAGARSVGLSLFILK